MEIEGAGINIGRFFICGGGKSVNIACVCRINRKGHRNEVNESMDSYQ